MKKLMVVGAGVYQEPLIEKAAEQCEVIIAAPVVNEKLRALASRIVLCDTRDKETVLQAAKEEKIDGIITDQTDIPVRTVAYVAEQLGLPGIGYETAKLFTDKFRMRERCKEIGVDTLAYVKTASLAEAEAFFVQLGKPVILKPTDNQGSRGVTKVTTAEELQAQFAESAKFSSTGEVLVEQFATGQEFLVEGLAYNHEFRNLCCGDTIYFDIPDIYSAITRTFPSAYPELAEQVCAVNRKIIEGFGLKQGITHSEFILTDEGQIILIETAARGGGVYISSDLISLSTGLCTEQFLIDIALGQQSGMPQLEQQKQCCGYMAFYLPQGTVQAISGVDKVCALPFVHSNLLHTIQPGNQIGDHVDKTSRYSIIVSGDTLEQLEERREQIRGMLHAQVRTAHGVQDIIWR